MSVSLQHKSKRNPVPEMGGTLFRATLHQLLSATDEEIQTTDAFSMRWKHMALIVGAVWRNELGDLFWEEKRGKRKRKVEHLSIL